jgi:hypothetical protein
MASIATIAIPALQRLLIIPPGCPTMIEREIFAAVLEVQDAYQRNQLLDNVCQGDAALSKRIAALLAEPEKLGNCLESPPTALARPEGPAIVPIAGRKHGVVRWAVTPITST